MREDSPFLEKINLPFIEINIDSLLIGGIFNKVESSVIFFSRIFQFITW